MASKKKTAATKTAKKTVHAEQLVDLEKEIDEARATLADAVGRYNDALEHAKATA